MGASEGLLGHQAEEEGWTFPLEGEGAESRLMGDLHSKGEEDASQWQQVLGRSTG